MLRGPRGRLKSIEAPPPPANATAATHKQQQHKSTTCLATADETAAVGALELQQFEFVETATETTEATTTTSTSTGAITKTTTSNTVNNVEFIPTLNFVSNKPAPAIATTTTSNEQQQAERAATQPTCANQEPSSELEDRTSKQTFV